jgi:antitoxin FitA
MSQLTVRNVSAEIVRALKKRAAGHGRSAEAEHREILREALLPESLDFAARAVRAPGKRSSGSTRRCADLIPEALASDSMGIPESLRC